MASPSISNTNQRTLAILQVAGLYAFTLIILVWIFMSNSRIPREKYQQLEKDHTLQKTELTEMRKAFLALGDIASASEELITLDQEELSTPGKVTRQIRREETILEEAEKVLNAVQLEDSITDPIWNALAILKDDRRELQRIRDSKTTSLEEKDESFDKERLDLQAENAKLNSEILSLQTTISTILANQQGGSGDGGAAELSACIKEKAGISSQAKIALGKVTEISTTLEAEKKKKSPFRNKRSIDILLQKIGQVQTTLEGI